MTEIERSKLSQESQARLAGENAFYADGLGVASYDLLGVQGSTALDGDVAFYIDCASRYGDPVLELGTGTGRVLWPLAQAGFRVTGVDLSAPMLQRAADKAAAYPADVRECVRLIRMDMTALDLDRRFPLALVPARAFHHLSEPEDQRRCIEALHRCLSDGGHLVIDLFDPRLDLVVPEGPSSPGDRVKADPETGLTVRRTVVGRTCDPRRQVVEEQLRFETVDASGKTVQTEETRWSLRWVLRQEMRYLFELTGFEVVEEFSDFFGAPPAYGKEQIWVVRRI